MPVSLSGQYRSPSGTISGLFGQIFAKHVAFFASDKKNRRFSTYLETVDHDYRCYVQLSCFCFYRSYDPNRCWTNGSAWVIPYPIHTSLSLPSRLFLISPSATTGINASAATLVERVLVDDILWYQQLILTEQQAQEGLGENTIAKKIKSKFEKAIRIYECSTCFFFCILVVAPHVFECT